MNFLLSIGDWSGDGHGRHEDFEIETELELDEVRRLYLRARDISELHPENVCSEYERYEVTETDLCTLGIERSDVECAEDPVEGSTGVYLDALGMARLWVAWMNQHTPETFRIVEECLPTFHWYGARALLGDENVDEIGFIGYGVV